MNNDLRAFDAIRPFEPEELPEVYDRLMADTQFLAVVAYLYPGIPAEAIAAKMHQQKTNLEFQKAFCYSFLEKLLAKASTGCDMDVESIDVNRNYTFISNHRDIVLDSALLDKLMFVSLTRLIGESEILGFHISFPSLIVTTVFILGTFFLIYLNMLRQIHLAKPIELLSGSNAGEREPKTKIIMTLLGLAPDVLDKEA